MKLNTVVLVNKRTGRKCIVNEHEYASDLGKGKWNGWRLEREEARHEDQEKAISEMSVHSPESVEEHDLNSGVDINDDPAHADASGESHDSGDSENMSNESDAESKKRRGRGRPRKDNK